MSKNDTEIKSRRTTQKIAFELSRRRALVALGTIGVASSGAGLGTSAYFSDQETFENNRLVTGELDLKALEQALSDYVDSLIKASNEAAFVTGGLKDRVASVLGEKAILAFGEIDFARATVAQPGGSNQYIKASDRKQSTTVRVKEVDDDEPAFIENGATAGDITIFVPGSIECPTEHNIVTSTLETDGIPGVVATKIAAVAHVGQEDGSRCCAGQRLTEYTSGVKPDAETEASSGGACCPSPTDLSQQDPVGGHRPHDVTLVGDEMRIDAQPITSPFSEGHTRRHSTVAS